MSNSLSKMKTFIEITFYDNDNKPMTYAYTELSSGLKINLHPEYKSLTLKRIARFDDLSDIPGILDDDDETDEHPNQLGQSDGGEFTNFTTSAVEDMVNQCKSNNV